MLKPLLFEVPGLTAETPFVGRDWLFTRLEDVLKKSSSCEGRGAVIVGNAGSGKTAIIWRLVTFSCHGTRTPHGGPNIPHSPSSSPKCKPLFLGHPIPQAEFIYTMVRADIEGNITSSEGVCNWVTHSSFKFSPDVCRLIAVLQPKCDYCDLPQSGPKKTTNHKPLMLMGGSQKYIFHTVMLSPMVL